MRENGKVYLVGAGPGNIDLITVKGLKAIKKADIIIYDRLIDKELLNKASKNAKFIDVGKKPDFHKVKQEDIGELLVKHSKEKKIVVRLKGGDPFVFGRGSEEALILEEQNIPYEVIPGVTSAIGVTSSVGIPVTHRNMSTSFHVITGHENPEKGETQVNFEAISKLNGTLIFLMGLRNLKYIVDSLIKFGKSMDTKIGIIEKGCSIDERVVIGNLGNIIELKEKNNLTSPVIIVVGEVVDFHNKINWQKSLPLYNKKILITKNKDKDSIIKDRLEDLGAKLTTLPLTKIKKNDVVNELESFFSNIENFSYIVFSSTLGVELFFEQFKKLNRDIRDLNNINIIAVGEVTKKSIENYLLKVDFVPREFKLEGILEYIEDSKLSGDILHLKANKGRTLLKDNYNNRVKEVNLYNTESIKIIEDLNLNIYDYIIFTSSSSVNEFFSILKDEDKPLLDNIKFVVIGPITKSSLESYGNFNIIMPNKYTIDSMIESLEEVNS